MIGAHGTTVLADWVVKELYKGGQQIDKDRDTDTDSYKYNNYNVS